MYSSKKICPICDSPVRPQDLTKGCPNCGWLLYLADSLFPDQYQYLEQWVKGLYQKASSSKVGSVSSKSTSPSSFAQDPRVEQLMIEMSQLKGQIGDLQGFSKTMTQTGAEQSRRLQQTAEETNMAVRTSNQLQQQIEQININLRQMDISLAAKFDSQIKSSRQELEKYLDGKVERLRKLFSFQSSAGQPSSNLSTESDISTSYSPNSSPSPTLIEAQTNEEAFDLGEEYNAAGNDIPQSITRDAVEVAMSAQSVAELRDKYTIPVLNRERRGDYLVVDRGTYSYLVPNKRNPINQYSLSIIKFLYDCTGYNENYQQMILEKPAIVNVKSPDSWMLTQKGSLKFT
jgi:hypothetical protein